MDSLTEIGMSVRRLQVRHHRALDAALRPLEISLVQWDALCQLTRHPDASLRDLAALTYQSEQAFGTLATRMIARGLIERIDGPGRAVRHGLTDRGEHTHQAGEAIIEQTLTKSFAALTSAQLRQFADLLSVQLPPQDPALGAAPQRTRGR